MMEAGSSDISVAIVSSVVGKSPREVTYSFVFDEAYRLVQRGVNVHVVRAAVEESSSSYGINFHGIRRRVDAEAFVELLKNLPLYSPFALLRNPLMLYWENLYALNISNVVENLRIDLIHAHFAYPEGFSGLIAKRRTKKPLVVTLHGYDILVEPSVKYGIRLSKRYDALVREVLVNADAVIVASRAVFEEAVKLRGRKSGTYLVHNGVDIKRFNPNLNGSLIRKRLGIENKFVVFSARHHRPVYGLEYLIKAAALVVKLRSDVVFVIGGEGPLRTYHEKLVEMLNLENNVIFTGRIPRDEMPHYYAASDAVVVPSLQEAWSLVVTEAMASGKPVVGTRVGGIVDQIIDGYNGFLVPPRDPKAIAEKILWLIDNPDEAKRMGMNGRRLAEEKFDIEKRIEKIIGIYKELVG
ncbi:glycosyltransferase [Thermofilum pendens]|nr:glycosyltransferase [Thermofilum pendens]